jgi:hypothetical protein
MLSKGFLKPNISIELIGRHRFWIGIILGFGFAVLMSYLINLSREALRLLSFFREPYIISHLKFRLYDLFFAFFSAGIGSGITLIVWLNVRKQIGRKSYRKLYASTYSWFIIILSLSILSRFGFLISYLLNALFGNTKHFDMLLDYKRLLILIPLFIFLSQWNAVQVILKMHKWKWYIIAGYLLTGLILFQTTKVDRNILNQPYYTRNKERFDYIANELDKIKSFGYIVAPETEEILRKKEHEETYNLVSTLKKSFSNNTIVPVDTLILEKIVIHNLNMESKYVYFDKEWMDFNWSYAMPEEIYWQIRQHNINSLETKILFEILSEQISILGVEDTPWEQRKSYTRDEMEYYRPRWKLLEFTRTIQSRMIQVIDKLQSESQYEKYFDLIPQIDTTNKFEQQIWYDIEL